MPHAIFSSRKHGHEHKTWYNIGKDVGHGNYLKCCTGDVTKNIKICINYEVMIHI